MDSKDRGGSTGLNGQNDAGIEFSNVTKSFDVGQTRVDALADINLKIEPGSFVGLVGANGSGKTSFAYLCDGLWHPTTGQVLISGISTRSADPYEVRSKVGIVFQNPANQIISSVVEEDTAFGPLNLGLSRDEILSRSEWALEVVGMSRFRSSDPSRLSGGQQQRVAIAAALAMKPKYLILDEPTAMLDARVRDNLLSTLISLNRDHAITIILITHNLEDIVLADRLIVLKDGRVFIDDTPAAVFSREEAVVAAGLRKPDIVAMADALRQMGHKLSDNSCTVKGLVEEICLLSKQTA